MCFLNTAVQVVRFTPGLPLLLMPGLMDGLPELAAARAAQAPPGGEQPEAEAGSGSALGLPAAAGEAEAPAPAAAQEPDQAGSPVLPPTVEAASDASPGAQQPGAGAPQAAPGAGADGAGGMPAKSGAALPVRQGAGAAAAGAPAGEAAAANARVLPVAQQPGSTGEGAACALGVNMVPMVGMQQLAMAAPALSAAPAAHVQAAGGAPDGAAIAEALPSSTAGAAGAEQSGASAPAVGARVPVHGAGAAVAGQGMPATEPAATRSLPGAGSADGQARGITSGRGSGAQAGAGAEHATGATRPQCAGCCAVDVPQAAQEGVTGDPACVCPRRGSAAGPAAAAPPGAGLGSALGSGHAAALGVAALPPVPETAVPAVCMGAVLGPEDLGPNASVAGQPGDPCAADAGGSTELPAGGPGAQAPQALGAAAGGSASAGSARTGDAPAGGVPATGSTAVEAAEAGGDASAPGGPAGHVNPDANPEHGEAGGEGGEAGGAAQAPVLTPLQRAVEAARERPLRKGELAGAFMQLTREVRCPLRLGCSSGYAIP